MLYDAWLKEKENAELQKLPKDFYTKTAEYIGKIRQEGRMLDQHSAKARLVAQELANVKRLVDELLTLRFKKIVKHASSAGLLDKEALTLEEERLHLGLKPTFEDFQALQKEFLRGKVSGVEERGGSPRRVVLRFVKEVPAIAGADLKVYGPFAAEDVAALPAENAKVLVKHGVAIEIEIR
jgi:DNA replication initiation complex subunit (GINS family)